MDTKLEPDSTPTAGPAGLPRSRRLIRRACGHHPRPDYDIPTGCRRVFIPFYGYLDADDDHRARVGRFFHVPMLVLALLVLPVLGLEYLQASSIEFPGSRFINGNAVVIAVQAAMVFIWLAFFVEFMVKISIAPSRLQYAKKNWVDILIIALPMLRLLRPLRGLRALRAARVTQLTRVYTLRGVMMKLVQSAVALVLGMEFVRKIQSRFRKPQRPDAGAARPEYARWSKASLRAEIRRLNERIEELEDEISTVRARTRPADDSADRSDR